LRDEVEVAGLEIGAPVVQLRQDDPGGVGPSVRLGGEGPWVDIAVEHDENVATVDLDPKLRRVDDRAQHRRVGGIGRP
jgi:hypothetical protein